MTDWLDYFYIFMIGTALSLSVAGLWFTGIMHGGDEWNRHFFFQYFFILIVNSLFGFIEMILQAFSASIPFIYTVLFLESLFLAVPMFMLPAFLLHSAGESLRGSRFLHTITGLGIAYLAVTLSSVFSDSFFVISPEKLLVRGPLYPLIPLPITVLMLLTLAGTIRRRKRLSRKTFMCLLVAVLPMTVSLFIHLFVDIFPLIDVSLVLTGLSMYSRILSEQIDQDLHREREIAKQQREIANQRARIMVLQMRPHFIYNTLMSIYSLCNLNPQKARQVTMDFTDYLRKNFNAVASETPVPFSAELDHTRSYLAVEKAQHEDMLLVEYDTRFTNFRLPPLTLQPIAENAVKHGMNPYAGPLHITIRTCHTDSAGVIVVEDNGPGFEAAEESESYPALKNIRERLEWMCEGKLEITSREGGGTVVTVTIPDPKTASGAAELPEPG